MRDRSRNAIDTAKNIRSYERCKLVKYCFLLPPPTLQLRRQEEALRLEEEVSHMKNGLL